MKIALIVAFIGIAVLAGTLSGCSTVAGMGTDLKGAAEWTHDKMTKPNQVAVTSPQTTVETK
jgi:predicted small secreted protein